MDKIEVNIDGIPYIHYLPQKMLRNNEHKEEMEIPINEVCLRDRKEIKYFIVPSYMWKAYIYKHPLNRLLFADS